MKSRGFSTIELMIALAILTLTMGAVVVVSFGTQTFLVSSQIDAEAMNEAQRLLEQEQAEGRKDFNLVNSTATTTDSTGFYSEAVYVRIVNDASLSYLTKEVKAVIAWRNVRGATSTLELTTLISNFDTPVGNSTCESTLTGDWAHPAIESTIDFSSLGGVPAGTYTISDVDAYRGKLYVTASKTSVATDPTFFIFDITNTASPTLLAKIDNEVSGGTVTAGLNAVRVSEDPTTGKRYAYTANANPANYATCNPVTKTNCGEIGVIDVSTPLSSGWSPRMTNLMFASSSVPSVTGTWSGNSLYYRNGYLFVGLAKAGGTGPEFHMVDVHLPSAMISAPLSGSHIASTTVGSFTVAHDVNAIAMRGTYAYLTTPDTQELKVLDLTNPTTPSLVSGYDAASGSGNGKSLYLIGNTLYLGKTTGNGGDFVILDITNPTSVQASNVNPPGVDVDIPTSNSVDGVLVGDYQARPLAFVLTNSDLRIFDIKVPAAITTWGTLTLPASGNVTEPSLDCEGNRLYISSNDSSGKGYVYVVKPS